MVPGIEQYTEKLKEFKQNIGRTLRGEVLHEYIEIEKILSGKSTKPNCSCSYRSWAEKVEVLYHKWEKTITSQKNT